MEGRPEGTPLKVCPHCSVASRTDADVCPSCGKPYTRRRFTLRWSWWFAIPIVAAAFLIGYFGLSNLFDGDDSDGESGSITLEQGAAVPNDISRGELEGHLDGEEPALVEPRRGDPKTTCSYYLVADQADTVWGFCFRRDELVSSAPIGGGNAPVQPEGADVAD
jgi:hypothetical protein